MYIREIPFMITTSQTINFGAAELKTQFFRLLLWQVLQAYHQKTSSRQWAIQAISKAIDGISISLNITGGNEHVP